MHTFVVRATTSWGLLMSLAPLLQVRVVVRRRTSAGVSIGWIAVLLIGFILWLCYGTVTGDPPIVITNSVSCVVAGLTLAVILLYRPRSGIAERRAAPPSRALASDHDRLRRAGPGPFRRQGGAGPS